MSGTSSQDGKIDTNFIKGLDLILESLISKTDVNTVNARSAADDGIELADSSPDLSDETFLEKNDDLEEDPENDSLATSTDLGDKTNLPPEMGRKDKGAEGLLGDGSVAEPNLRVRKAVLTDMERGVDLFKIWATVDRVIEKSSEAPERVSDVDILKAFELDPDTTTEEISDGTLVYKMLSDRASRPSVEWWNEALSFAKSFSDVEEPAFFASFLYYESEDFAPEIFMKGLNDTGGTPRTSRRGISHDTEIDENIGAAGGQAIDGLGLSNDGHEDEEEHIHKA